jgi:DUF1680 family protein
VVEEGGSGPWTLSLRMPAWSESTGVRFAMDSVHAADDPVSQKGYARLEGTWRAGDTVDVELSMEPHLTEAHPWIESTRGCVAIERGPLVYCLEQPDQQAPVYDLEINTSGRLTAEWQPDLLDGVAVVHGYGYEMNREPWEGRLYRTYAGAGPTMRPVPITAIPVYAWANRGPNAMKIWIPLR